MMKIKKPKKHLWASALFLLTVILINAGLYFVNKKPVDMFQNVAVSIILTWIIFLVAYYVWAIGFYNINLGWTDEDWAAKSGKKAELIENMREEGKMDVTTVTPVTTAEKEPEDNPHAGESLGLPPGTVRASIALSLLVAGLSTTIASFSMNNTYPLNTLFIDHFEFFKTGFLMMIAFYFGAKTLDILRNTSNAVVVAKGKVDKKNAEEEEGGANDKPETPQASAGKKVFEDPTARG